MVSMNSDSKGRTMGGRFTWRSRIQADPDEFGPTSNYWVRQANGALAELNNAMGDDAYDAWYDAAITDQDNPRQIHDKAVAKLYGEETPVEHKLDLDCVRYAGAW